MEASSSSHENHSQPHNFQNVIVMRHGDRMDHADPLWVTTAARPWDPPLIHSGKARAFSTGRRLRTQLTFPIHRVFVSPFLRCLQTASEVISALCAVDDGNSEATTADGVAIDPSKLKVSIEYGLCEMLNTEAFGQDVAPKDGDFKFNLPELEAVLPAGVVDHAVKPVYKELPKWEETVLGARDRYKHIILALADMYPSENLLLVTHGEGVGVSVSSCLENTTVYEVEYCDCSHLRRPLSSKNDSSASGRFELVTGSGQNGISYMSSDALADYLTSDS